MDIVYLVKNDLENNSEELRYSLRSLKNIPHDKVIIVGEKPDWATNVTFISVAQDKAKNENVKKNLQTAVASELVSDNFILMNDDFFFMKEMSAMPNLNFGLMKNIIEQYDARYPDGSDYIRNMKKLYEVLMETGINEPISYELHTPMVLNKQKVQKLYAEATQSLYQFRSFYGNHYSLGGETVPDVKVFLHEQHNDSNFVAQPEAYLENQAFLSVTGGSFKRGLAGEFIRSKFTEKSIYEL